MKRLALLGSTGSIGHQALDVADRHRDRLQVTALATGRDLDELCRQARAWRPSLIGLERAVDVTKAGAQIKNACPEARVVVGSGAAALVAAEADCDIVLNGIVGAAGLAPSLGALAAGRRLALANKETLVIGGPLVRTALEDGGELVPIDSEHSAALQCLHGRAAAEVETLVLTASGGPLRDHANWRQATCEEVLAHPVWSMGRRITVDSALLFNKGLELIEARWLFGLEWHQLDAVMHPQARVHAWVEFVDGSVVTQAAPPDMRLPIQLAASWPEHWPDATLPRLRLPLHDLTFTAIERGRYPAFDLAVAAGKAGGTAPCALNAADEVAVEAFLEGAIPLGQVPEVIEAVMEAHTIEPVESLAQLERVDAWARAEARGRAVRV